MQNATMFEFNSKFSFSPRRPLSVWMAWWSVRRPLPFLGDGFLMFSCLLRWILCTEREFVVCSYGLKLTCSQTEKTRFFPAEKPILLNPAQCVILSSNDLLDCSGLLVPEAGQGSGSSLHCHHNRPWSSAYCLWAMLLDGWHLFASKLAGCWKAKLHKSLRRSENPGVVLCIVMLCCYV